MSPYASIKSVIRAVIGAQNSKQKANESNHDFLLLFNVALYQ